VKLSANPFDDIALEEALRLREKGVATDVVVATIGPADAQAHLRNGLAMGANRALHVVTAGRGAAAHRGAHVPEADREGAAADRAARQAGDRRRLQARPGRCWPRSGAGRRPRSHSKIEVNGGVARVTREIDAGLEVIEVDLPAVITVDLRLNEPRFIKLPDIMKAKSKPLETIAFESLGVESGDHHKVTRYAPPPKRSKGVMVKDVPELVAALKAKGLL
jgi:electron transfer flavoprotein beta subunit